MSITINSKFFYFYLCLARPLSLRNGSLRLNIYLPYLKKGKCLYWGTSPMPYFSIGPLLSYYKENLNVE